MKLPNQYECLWGLWITDGGEDESGHWMQQISGSEKSPMAFLSKESAERHAVYERDNYGFNNLVVHPLITERKRKINKAEVAWWCLNACYVTLIISLAIAVLTMLFLGI